MSDYRYRSDPTRENLSSLPFFLSPLPLTGTDGSGALFSPFLPGGQRSFLRARGKLQRFFQNMEESSFLALSPLVCRRRIVSPLGGDGAMPLSFFLPFFSTVKKVANPLPLP